MLIGLKIDVGILLVAACIAKGLHLLTHIGCLLERLNLLTALKLIIIQSIAVDYPLSVLAFHFLPIGHFKSLITTPPFTTQNTSPVSAGQDFTKDANGCVFIRPIKVLESVINANLSSFELP